LRARFGGAALERITLPPLPPNLARKDETPAEADVEDVTEPAGVPIPLGNPVGGPPPPPPDTTPPPATREQYGMRPMPPAPPAPAARPPPAEPPRAAAPPHPVTPPSARPPEPLPPAPVPNLSPPRPRTGPQLALPPYPGHGAPPRSSPPRPSAEAEAAFFDGGVEEPTPVVMTGTPPADRGRMVWVIAAGLIVGGAATAIYLVLQEPRSVDVPDHPVVAVVDAGAVEPVVIQDVPDAAEEVVAVPEIVDSGLAAVPEVNDAGAVAVAPVVNAVPDAGAAVVVAPVVKDAGAAVVAVQVPDAGAAVVVVAAKPDAGTAAPVGVAGDLEALLADAKLAIQKQRWKSAMEAYRKALKSNPESDEAKMGLGIALVMSETGFKEAVPLLNAGVKTDPKNAQAWLALGMAYQNIGQDAAAKKPYTEYLKLQPKGATSDEIRAALEAMK
jgi:hypothetical protein